MRGEKLPATHRDWAECRSRGPIALACARPIWMNAWPVCAAAITSTAATLITDAAGTHLASNETSGGNPAFSQRGEREESFGKLERSRHRTAGSRCSNDPRSSQLVPESVYLGATALSSTVIINGQASNLTCTPHCLRRTTASASARCCLPSVEQLWTLVWRATAPSLVGPRS